MSVSSRPTVLQNIKYTATKERVCFWNVFMLHHWTAMEIICKNCSAVISCLILSIQLSNSRELLIDCSDKPTKPPNASKIAFLRTSWLIKSYNISFRRIEWVLFSCPFHSIHSFSECEYRWYRQYLTMSDSYGTANQLPSN